MLWIFLYVVYGTSKAGFPSNATYAMHARKYVTTTVNAINARKVRSKRI